jgi:ABC-type sugar transport system ATPase subunit
MDQGVLRQLGTPDDLYERPANLFVAQFIGEPPMNLLPGRLERRADGLVLHGTIGALPLPATAAVDLESGERPDVVIGVRAEHLRLSEAASSSPGLSGAVFFREPRGDIDVVLVEVDRSVVAPLAVEVEPATRWRAGDRVRVGVADARLHVFDSVHGTRR